MKRTDRVRKVLQLAESEAKRLGHDLLGTEHMLLGILAEGENLACAVLTNLPNGLPKLDAARKVTAFLCGGKAPRKRGSKRVASRPGTRQAP